MVTTHLHHRLDSGLVRRPERGAQVPYLNGEFLNRVLI